MDMSSFTSQWEDQLSSLNQHPILTADHQLHTFSVSSVSPNPHNYPMVKAELSPSACSPPQAAVEASSYGAGYDSERARKSLRTISWSSGMQVPLVTKEGASMEYLSFGQEHGVKRARSTPGLRPAYPHDDHIIAERKRREKLSQRFIALAAIIPGLKKADKATILGDAITHIKDLEHSLKSLHDHNRKRMVESVFVNKSRLSADDNGNVTDENPDGISSPISGVCSGSGDNFDGIPNMKLPPEIQVKLSDNTVLVKIHCEKHKGLLSKLLQEIEKLELTVTNAGVMPFAGSFLDITITAQTEEGFSMTMKDLAREISSIFHQCFN